MSELNIDTSTIKSNSHRSRAQKASNNSKNADRLDPIVKKGGVVSTKKPLGQKFVETFVSEDVDDIKSYILMDVIIPGIKNTFLDIMEMAFYGSTSNRRGSGYYRRDDRTDYRSYYGSWSTQDSQKRRRESSRRDEKLDYRHIVLKYRDETESVIDELQGRIRKNGSASIADLYDLIGEPSNYNDNNWGWTDERDIRLRRVANGFLIVVPEADYID